MLLAGGSGSGFQPQRHTVHGLAKKVQARTAFGQQIQQGVRIPYPGATQHRDAAPRIGLRQQGGRGAHHGRFGSGLQALQQGIQRIVDQGGAGGDEHIGMGHHLASPVGRHVVGHLLRPQGGRVQLQHLEVLPPLSQLPQIGRKRADQHHLVPGLQLQRIKGIAHAGADPCRQSFFLPQGFGQGVERGNRQGAAQVLGPMQIAQQVAGQLAAAMAGPSDAATTAVQEAAQTPAPIAAEDVQGKANETAEAVAQGEAQQAVGHSAQAPAEPAAPVERKTLTIRKNAQGEQPVPAEPTVEQSAEALVTQAPAAAHAPSTPKSPNAAKLKTRLATEDVWPAADKDHATQEERSLDVVNARYGNSPAIDKVRAMVAVVRGRTAATGIGKRTVNKYQDHEGNDIAMTAIAAKINERLKVAEGSPGAVTASWVKANLPQVMSDIEHYATINMFEPGTRSAPVQEAAVGEDGMPTFVGDYIRSEGVPSNQVAWWTVLQRCTVPRWLP